MLQSRIAELAEQHGSLAAAARVLMVDKGYLHRLSTGEKDDPGDDLLRRMKLRRVVSYERTDGVAVPDLSVPDENAQKALSKLEKLNVQTSQAD